MLRSVTPHLEECARAALESDSSQTASPSPLPSTFGMDSDTSLLTPRRGFSCWGQTKGLETSSEVFWQLGSEHALIQAGLAPEDGHILESPLGGTWWGTTRQPASPGRQAQVPEL